MTSGSLRLRLVAGGAVAVVLALVVAGAGLVHLFERHVLRALANDLEVELRQALATIEIGPDGRPFLRREPSDPRFADPLSGLYWQAATEAGGIARSRSLWDATLPLPEDTLAPGEVHQHRIPGPGGSELLAVERTVLLNVKDKPTPVRVVIAADLVGIAEARQLFIRDLVPALGLLGLALAAATWVQIGLGLKPLKRLRDGIAAIRQGQRRQLEGPAPTEVEPLVEEINGLLAAQAREMERSQRRAADLAHGLKTPLAALAADARRLDEKGEHELAASIEDVGESMLRHVDRELARARIRGPRGLSPVSPTPLRPLVETLIAMQSRAESRQLVFENVLEGEPILPMDKADLAEVLGNLIENAARHARSRIRIGARQDGRVFIEDDGPGIPKSLRATVMEHGERLDSKGEDGAGLGLAIVQEVLEAYDRRLILETSDLGGIMATF